MLPANNCKLLASKDKIRIFLTMEHSGLCDDKTMFTIVEIMRISCFVICP